MPRRRKWPKRVCSRRADRKLRPQGALLRRVGGVSVACLAAAWTCCAASTPQAWSAYDQEVLEACVAASSLREVRPAGARVDFDDRIGYSALLIVGHYPQPHMRNQPGRELCLFDNAHTLTLFHATS
ncbi:MAG: hypothetical protein WCB10_15245 [Steroidobacteraceae bacterium]